MTYAVTEPWLELNALPKKRNFKKINDNVKMKRVKKDRDNIISVNRACF